MNENKNARMTRALVTSGILGALSVVLGATHIGLIPWFAGASLTVMHIPVILAAILEGPWAGMAVGAIFGVSSLIQAAVAPTGVLDPVFTNPLVSVLPRLLIGPIAWALYRLVAGKNTVETGPRIAAASIVSAAAASLAHTALVLGLLKAFAIGDKFSFLTWQVVGGVAVANGLPEAGLAAILVTGIMLAWKKLVLGSGKASLSKDEGDGKAP